MGVKKLAISLLLAFCLISLPGESATPVVEYDGTASIAAGAHTIYLDSNGGLLAFHHVTVWTSSGASTVNITFNQATAATTNSPLYGGAVINYGFTSPLSLPINQFNYYGAGTTGSISWMAW
jgi:hypothetical protein